MRISTAELFGNGIAAIQHQQAQLARTQQQLATGRRLLSPADDPGGAVQALKLRERIAAVDQYARNATLATSRLQQEETVLAQMGDSLQRIRELTVQAANASQSNESRAGIASELQQIAAGLLDLANTRDASGEYLFAGYRSMSRPFVRDTQGVVEYLGDAGQRRVGLSPERSIAVGDSGEVFLSIPRGNGVFTVQPDAANGGTGWVSAADVTDPSLAGNATLSMLITATGTYEIRDADDLLVADGPFVAGQAIDVGGRRIVLDGAPLAGDRFAIAPAGGVSLFAIVDDLAAALATPRSGALDMAQLRQVVGDSLQNLDQALGRILEVRTEVGARLNSIERQGIVSAEQQLQLQTVLSGIEDLDYAEAISRFNLQQVALQAAQQTYVQLNRFSLFDLIR